MVYVQLNSALRLARDIPSFLYELNCSRRDGVFLNSERSHYTMRKLYNLSGGYLTELFSKFLSPKRLPKSAFRAGFKRFPPQDPRVLKQLTQMKCAIFGESRKVALAQGDVSDLLSFGTGRIVILEEELFANNDIAELVTKGPWIDEARKVLGVEPVARYLSAWWSVPTTEDRLSEAAQLWHRDIDWLRELKIFFYATDVGPDNGPFEFVEGSHLPSWRAISNQDGRRSDFWVRSHYPASRIVSMSGRVGDTFMVDTQAIHRGRPVETGRRCLLQLNLSSHYFGAEFLCRPRISLNSSWPSYKTWKRAVEEKPLTWTPLFNDRAA